MYKKERNYEVKTNSIEVRNFSKKFGDFTAVDNISFDVEQGTIFAFLGPNGAGKSTTINTLCTIQEKTEGMLKINGNDVSKQKDLVRNDIGIVFQDSTMDGKLTVEENLKLHCDFYKVPKSEVKERIDFVLDLVDIKSRKKSPVDSLSGGMKRRAEIARGLVHFPKVLFLDEPTTGLDPQTRASVWDYIHKLQKQKNITIFLTTHYMDEAEICNQVAIIDGGKIVAHDTPANLKKKYTSTTMKLKTNDADSLKTYMTERSIKHSVDKDLVTIYATSTADVLDITNTFRESIEDIEINKGTLNDVFIAITGKEIRE
ncbi:ABC transporter related protein [Paludibacter propionicigenes WB4]|uniref:ABC transporter related protein n=1 Tax=Paludibacter propionicigenes (strain DSM 17365 / JCM 13257 / WB4) TaxID=694427 RepID=E4T0Q7_PALPW|nr:ATP-binding cassette domain-containing protein [Paludibacter propionicigenes]ADQ78182.1 ABC transporter related protein [Paludibacter propionicigenes WB4]